MVYGGTNESACGIDAAARGRSENGRFILIVARMNEMVAYLNTSVQRIHSFLPRSYPVNIPGFLDRKMFCCISLSNTRGHCGRFE